MQTTVYFHTESGNLRTVLTIFFIILLLLIDFVGGICLKLRNQVRLLSKRNVLVSHMTPWLKFFDGSSYLIKTRRLPGGWMAIPMFLSALLVPACHILVSKYVRTVMWKGQCVFGSGVVIAKSPSFFLGHRTNPSSAWPPARITADAQATSARNGCLDGIYWKANEDPNFCAGPADVAGGWSCKDQNQDVQYPAGTSWELIYPDLYSRDLLYAKAASSVWQKPRNVEIGLIALSPSVGDNVQQAWDVKASINTGLNPNKTINIKHYFCSMTSANVSFTLNYTNS